MNELTAPIIRFRHAADAIGVSKKTLRNWLARGQVELESPTEGWASFSRIDLMRLAITAELVRFGMGVVPAFRSAFSHVSAATQLLAAYKNTPAAMMTLAFKGRAIAVQQASEGKWQIVHLKPTATVPDDFTAASTLIVDTDILARQVEDRLVESLEDEDGD